MFFFVFLELGRKAVANTSPGTAAGAAAAADVKASDVRVKKKAGQGRWCSKHTRSLKFRLSGLLARLEKNDVGAAAARVGGGRGKSSKTWWRSFQTEQAG